MRVWLIRKPKPFFCFLFVYPCVHFVMSATRSSRNLFLRATPTPTALLNAFLRRCDPSSQRRSELPAEVWREVPTASSNTCGRGGPEALAPPPSRSLSSSAAVARPAGGHAPALSSTGRGPPPPPLLRHWRGRGGRIWRGGGRAADGGAREYSPDGA